MKKIFFICLFLFVTLFHLQAQSKMLEKSCCYGLTYEFSKNPNWGNGELVITSVDPDSPAEEAGIKVGDIIMEINGKATYLRDTATISTWLFDVYEPTTNFTIRNMDTYFKEYTLYRKCVNANSISEQQLSTFFSFYSFENTSKQHFTIPVKVTPRQDVQYTDYHTYDFFKGAIETNTPPIDIYVTTLLNQELQAKGLVRDTKDPDLIVQSYYMYDPNPKYKESDANKDLNSIRFDANIQRMVSLPIIDAEDENAEEKSKYIVEYGFSFYDHKYLEAPRLIQIWDANIKDYLSKETSLEEYIKIHTPLLLMQFPYTEKKDKSTYETAFNKYNYTGLYFNAEDLTIVQDVDFNSPAYRAGIRAGHVVNRINGKEFKHTKETLSEGYKRFIIETMLYRNPESRFTNSDGFNECMHWDTSYYAAIAKAFEKPDYMTIFAYLYNFEEYVNNKLSKDIMIEVWDGTQTRIFSVTPEIRESISTRVID